MRNETISVETRISSELVTNSDTGKISFSQGGKLSSPVLQRQFPLVPLDFAKTVEIAEEGYKHVTPDQEYIDWVQRSRSGIWIPIHITGVSREDMARYGFNSEPISSKWPEWSERVDSALRFLSSSRVLRAAGAAILALTGVAFLAEHQQSEALSIQPLDYHPGYSPLFPHGEMIRYDDSLQGLNTEAQVVPSTATLMHGDITTVQMRQNVLLVADEGTSMDMLQRVANVAFITSPFDEQAATTNIFGVKTSEPLGCNQQGKCNDVAVRRVIDKNIASTGIIFQETEVVRRSDDPFIWTGWTPALESKQGPTSIYTYSTLVIPERTEVNKMLTDKEVKQGDASVEDHERAHGVYGIGHEGEDMMEDQWKCNPTGAGDGGMCYTFNEEHKRTIRTKYPTFPGSYYTPTLLEPAPGITTGGLGVNLRFKPYEAVKQFQVQVVPFNKDGPGINLIIGDPKAVQAGTFNVLAPELGVGNYVMLPGMSYTWRARVTSVTGPVGENDPVWGLWSEERKFKTPITSSDTLRLPDRSSLVSLSETPFVWDDLNKSNFYYEVQVSGDSRFDPDPKTATSFVWWNLVHGGMTNPLNSWKAPQLEPNTTYFWRVRPRVQGDGKPVEWGPTWAVKVGADSHSYTYLD